MKNRKQNKAYLCWVAMRQRVHDKGHCSYCKYGAKGVTICPEWDNFEIFLMDMGERPEGTTLDRRDGTKRYDKENCRWASPTIQSINRKFSAVSSSGTTGVHKKDGKWIALISINGRSRSLGTFTHIEDAIKARKDGEEKYYRPLLDF